jgi:hypothetical protein
VRLEERVNGPRFLVIEPDGKVRIQVRSHITGGTILNRLLWKQDIRAVNWSG